MILYLNTMSLENCNYELQKESESLQIQSLVHSIFTKCQKIFKPEKEYDTLKKIYNEFIRNYNNSINKQTNESEKQTS